MLPQGMDHAPVHRDRPGILRYLPQLPTDSEAGKKVASGTSVIVGAIGAVIPHALFWPIRLGLFAALGLATRGALLLLTKRLGVVRSTIYLSRGIGSLIGAGVSAFLTSAMLWAILGHDPGIPAMIVLYAAFLPVWWLFLAWWAATSPVPMTLD